MQQQHHASDDRANAATVVPHCTGALMLDEVFALVFKVAVTPHCTGALMNGNMVQFTADELQLHPTAQGP